MSRERKAERPREEDAQETDVKKEVISWVRMLVIVVAVAFFLTHFIIMNVKVPSGSMENTIMTGDRLIASRLAYRFSEPDRGDIIIFHYPVDESLIYIKRVIGLPGETIEIKDGHIYIDGSDTPLEESYLKEEWLLNNDGYTFHVPENCYFVMGDNRNNSEDGRRWADIALQTGVAATEEEAEQYSYVKADEIEGKAIFKYWSSVGLLH